MFIAILSIGILAVACFIFVRIKFAGIYGLMTKLIASFFFILLAIVANTNNPNQFGALIITGLVIGLIGDAFLDLRQIDEKNRSPYTRAGMLAFSIGHIPFIYAITNDAAFSPQMFGIATATSLIFAAVAISLEKPLKLHYGNFRALSFVYGFILATMTACAIIAALNFDFQNMRYNILSLAGVLFIISDLILSTIYFDKAQNKHTPINIFTNHVTYYTAQFLIASSIMF